ncbi:MAG: N-succinylarginine dihydrolase [Proteobacteria bacterium]|nr:N-succinylarginine dihydrolase [Pseudomonadota bacterium]
MLQEINFDGIVGPTHNFAGLSLGNLAATRNAGSPAFPREAALQGVAKMRACLALGLTQGVLLPHDRPDGAWLTSLGTDPEAADAGLLANALSASPMWAANAATVSPAPDTADHRCHLTVANLVTMPHRSHEWPGTLAQLRLAFADPAAFAVHGPVPAPFGDEGAANHMRLAPAHDAPGVEVFVYGEGGGPFPARQHREASAAVARLHRLDPARTILAQQSVEAIAAGAFHNDVVAVANGPVLFTHEQAFAEPQGLYAQLRARLPGAEVVEVPASAVSLADAIGSYLFNAQLVTLPSDGGMALVLPTEARDNQRVWQWLEGMVAGNGPIRQLVPVEVRQSMANGGGPACLRLRVVADPATVDPRFMVDAAKLDAIGEMIERHWPARIEPGDLTIPALWAEARAARLALLELLGLTELA